jgi:hypothetical protein
MVNDPIHVIQNRKARMTSTGITADRGISNNGKHNSHCVCVFEMQT